MAHCWAHARRKLKKVFDRDGSEIAAEGLRRIAEFYAIEADIRGVSHGQRLSARQARTASLVAAFDDWLQAQRRKISTKSRLGEKLAYIHNHWDGLQTFLHNGHVEIDSNRVENLIRPIAKRGSLCGPSSSICKHWKCVRIDHATRAPFSGYGSFDPLRGQVLGTDLIRRAGYDLLSLQYAGFDKVPYPVICHA